MTATTPNSPNFITTLVMSFVGNFQKNSRKLLTSVIAILIVLAVWQLLCSGAEPALPPPSKVIDDTWDLIVDPFFDRGGTDKGLFLHLAASLMRVAQGFLLAAIVGIGVGIIIGSNIFVYDAVDPIFQVLRTVPPLAWLPISLAAFKDSQPSAIFVIFITSVWPILINTAVGVQQVPQDYKNVAKVLQLSKFEYFVSVLFPAIVPYVFTGLRIGVGLSWLAIVAAEMLIGGVGIGFFIWDSWNSSLISEIIIALIYVGIVGLLLDKLVVFLGSLVLPPEQK